MHRYKVHTYYTGSIIVEMALSLPVFLTFLLGTIEINRYFWTAYWLEHSLHQAIRSESLEPGRGVTERLKDNINNALLNADRIRLTQKTQNIGEMEITHWTASYETRFYFYSQEQLSLTSNGWSFDGENIIE